MGWHQWQKSNIRHYQCIKSLNITDQIVEIFNFVVLLFFLTKILFVWSQAVFSGTAIVLYITVDCATAASQNEFSEYKPFVQEDQYYSENEKNIKFCITFIFKNTAVVNQEPRSSCNTFIEFCKHRYVMQPMGNPLSCTVEALFLPVCSKLHTPIHILVSL
jgi:hypothetical protein